jgi:hypothetical protein
LRCSALQCVASRLRRYKLGSLNYIRGSQRPPFTTVFHLRQNDHECVGSVAEVRPPYRGESVSAAAALTTVEHSLVIA